MGSMRGAHGIAVLQVLRKMVLEVGRLLVHALHPAVRRLMRGLRMVRAELLPLRGVLLLRLLTLLLLQRC